MTGHEIGAALGVAVLSMVASTAGTLTTSAGAADAFSRGFVGAAAMGAAFAVFALLRTPKYQGHRRWRPHAHALTSSTSTDRRPSSCLSRNGGARAGCRDIPP